MNAEEYELIDMLLDAHDGDDRCKCLATAVRDALADDSGAVLRGLRECIRNHPAGRTFRSISGSGDD